MGGEPRQPTHGHAVASQRTTRYRVVLLGRIAKRRPPKTLGSSEAVCHCSPVALHTLASARAPRARRYGSPRIAMRRRHGSLGPIIQRRDRAISNYRDTLRPASRLWFGGTISRAIGTFVRKIHERPGTTFSNIQMLHLCLAGTGFRASVITWRWRRCGPARGPAGQICRRRRQGCRGLPEPETRRSMKMRRRCR